MAPYPSHRLRPLLATLAAGVLGLSLLAGCSEEPEPKFSETSTTETPSPSQTTPAEPTEPPRPAALDNGDAAGARAMVRYYFALWDYALDTGDVSTMTTLIGPLCTTCERVAFALRKSIANGATVIGGRHTVRSIKLTRLQSQQKSAVRYFVESEVYSTAQTVRGSGIKGLDGKFGRGTTDYEISLVFWRDKWTIAHWETS